MRESNILALRARTPRTEKMKPTLLLFTSSVHLHEPSTHDTRLPSLENTCQNSRSSEILLFLNFITFLECLLLNRFGFTLFANLMPRYLLLVISVVVVNIVETSWMCLNDLALEPSRVGYQR